MGFQLIDSLGRVHNLDRKLTKVGPGTLNDILLSEMSGNGTIFEVQEVDGQWQAISSGSAALSLNGAVVNGPLYLRHMDVISANGVSLRFVDTSQIASAPGMTYQQPVQPQYPGAPAALGGVQQPYFAAQPSKDKLTAGLLAILLGGIGVHHFYLGNTVLGIVYLLFSWTGVPLVISIIEGIIYLSKSDAEWLRKYPPILYPG